MYTQALIIPTTIDQYTRQVDWGMIFMVILYMEVNLIMFDGGIDFVSITLHSIA